MAKFTVDDFRIAYVFDIEEPITEEKLAAGLEGKGFTVQKNRYISSSNMPVRITILNIANKGRISVLYQKDDTPTFIGLSGKDTNEVLKQFEVLGNLLQQLDPFLLQQKRYIEAVITAKVWTQSTPGKEIPKLGGDAIKKLADSSGTNLKLISAVISPEGSSSLEGWQMKIEQLIRNPKYYFVQYIRRSIEKKDVLADAYSSGDFITGLIDQLESAK